MTQPFDPLRPAARAIVIHNNKVLIMKRTKPNGIKYMVTPGGRLEPGESAEDAVLREVTEETTVTIADPQLVFIEDPNDGRWGMQYIYLCRYVSGEPILNPESEEYEFQQQGLGTFEPLWLSYDQLDDMEFPFRSTRLGEEIRTALKSGFPHIPKEWKLDAV